MFCNVLAQLGEPMLMAFAGDVILRALIGGDEVPEP